MHKKIIWKLPDGSIQVTTGANHYTDADIDKVAARVKEANPDLKDAVRMPDCNPEDLPSREFRHKWRHDGKKLFVDTKLPDKASPVNPNSASQSYTAQKLQTQS